MGELIWVITGVSAVVVALATSVFITAARVAALERKARTRQILRGEKRRKAGWYTTSEINSGKYGVKPVSEIKKD